jgi:PIN domain nuclease of toxin-antitoxin system
MNLLLDTHVILWWLNDDPMLSERSRTMEKEICDRFTVPHTLF